MCKTDIRHAVERHELGFLRRTDVNLPLCLSESPSGGMEGSFIPPLIHLQILTEL